LIVWETKSWLVIVDQQFAVDISALDPK